MTSTAGKEMNSNRKKIMFTFFCFSCQNILGLWIMLKTYIPFHDQGEICVISTIPTVYKYRFAQVPLYSLYTKRIRIVDTSLNKHCIKYKGNHL